MKTTFQKKKEKKSDIYVEFLIWPTSYVVTLRGRVL